MRKACRRLPCSLVLAGAVLLAGSAAWGQITSSPSIVGSGARALGMGGAFIAIADDATAASWNPGGLTQLERPEISLVYRFKWVTEDFYSSSQPGLEEKETIDFNDLNYFSVAYPIPRTIAGRNLVLSLNYQQQYDFERRLSGDFRQITNQMGAVTNIFTDLDYHQQGALASISPAFGFEITDKFSVGLAVNLYYHQLLPENKWQSHSAGYRRLLSILPGGNTAVMWPHQTFQQKYDNFEGINYTIGVLYKPIERLSIGAVYHTSFTADVDYTETIRAFAYYEQHERHLEYQFPSAIGLGVAFRFPGDKLTLSLDVTRRQWDQFEIHDPENRSFEQQRRSGVTDLPVDKTEVDPTHTVRLGAEYVFVDEKRPRQRLLPSLRAGLFYDPEPSGGRHSQAGIGALALDEGDGHPEHFWGFSVGTGLLIMNRVNLDFAYMFRHGPKARSDTYGLFGFQDTHAEVLNHSLYFSTVVYF